MINRGPVDVLVMAAGEPRFEGNVFAELKRQTAADTIWVLDAMVLLKDEQGHAWRLDLADLPAEQKDAVGFIAAESRGLFDSEDTNTLFEGDVITQLERLGALYAQGLLTEQEFAAQKAALLGS